MSIVHVWSKFAPKDDDSKRRYAVAQKTWESQRWIDCGVPDENLPRAFMEGNKRFVYMRDLFDAGCYGRDDSDIIVYTNADIGITSTFCFRIAVAMQLNAAGYSNRRDAHHKVEVVPSDDEILGWRDYCGTDTFFFRKVWWQKYRLQMPDMLIAREAWDACLRVLIEITCSNKPLSVPDISWHERHGGPDHWESDANRYTRPSQKHNLHLAKMFMLGNGKNPAHFGIR